MIRPRSIWLNLLTLAVSALFSLAVLEFALFLMYRYQVILIEPPSYNVARVLNGSSAPAHFCDTSREFGTWHLPNSHFVHDRACFSVPYSFNSFGARDTERSRQSSEPRAVMLGDSFVEGYGLKTEERLSDLMEAWSGREVLNFGVAGNAGTVQYWLIYRHLASKFDHSLVLVGILPDNDFQDNDYEYGLSAYANRFRPYLVGRYPDYQLLFFNQEFFDPEAKRHPWEVFATHCLREFTFSYRTLRYVIHRRNQDRAAAVTKDSSGYYDFRPQDWDLMRFSLEQLCGLAQEKGAKVVVFAIPREKDVLHYKMRGYPRLSRRLQALGDEVGFVFVDLLPGFVEQCWGDGARLAGCWLPCDPHWSDRGSRAALEVLKPYLLRMGFGPTLR
jgi:hypothetical protein